MFDRAIGRSVSNSRKFIRCKKLRLEVRDAI